MPSHSAMKVEEVMENKVHVFLASAFAGDVQSASRSSGERTNNVRYRQWTWRVGKISVHSGILSRVVTCHVWSYHVT
jgi:hypothetical protein